jgi:hypothetical protein
VTYTKSFVISSLNQISVYQIKWNEMGGTRNTHGGGTSYKAIAQNQKEGSILVDTAMDEKIICNTVLKYRK